MIKSGPDMIEKDKRFTSENPKDLANKLSFLNGESIMISLETGTRRRFDEIFSMIDRKVLDDDGNIRNELRSDQAKDYIVHLDKIISAFRAIEDFPQEYLTDDAKGNEQVVEELAQEIIGLALSYQAVLKGFLGEGVAPQVVESTKSAERFDPKKFFRELVRRPEFSPNPLGKLAQFIDRYDVDDVQLNAEYPSEMTIPDKLKTVEDDISGIRKMLLALNAYYMVTVMGEEFSDEKRDQIEKVIRPVWEKLVQRLEERHTKLNFEQWKETFPEYPIGHFFQKISKTKAQVSYSDRNSAQVQLEAFNNAIKGLNEVITAEQKKFKGQEDELKAFIQNEYITPIEAQVQPLEDEVYRLWIQEMDKALDELVQLTRKKPTDLKEYKDIYEQLEFKMTSVARNKKVWVNQLPTSKQLVGSSYIQTPLDSAEQKLKDLSLQQWAELTNNILGNKLAERVAMQTAITDANKNRTASDVKGVLQPHEQLLVTTIATFSAKINQEKANLIQENQDNLSGWIEDETRTANEALAAIRRRINDVEDQTGELAKGRIEEKIQDILDLNLDTKEDYFRVTIAQLETMRKSMIDALSSSGLRQDQFSNYSLALQKIDEYIQERKRPKYMNWQELTAAVGTLDMWKHGEFQKTNSDPRSVEIYNKVHGNDIDGEPTVSLVDGKEKETPQERKERLEQKVLLQLRTLQNEIQSEGKKASTDRERLFAELKVRTVYRSELLEATTCHEDYGMEIREILEYSVVEGARRDSKINYEILTNEGRGRISYQNHIKEVFASRLGASAKNFTEAQINTIFELSFLLFYSFNLIDVIFAEDQKQTATKSHSPTDKDDRTLLTRPDAALVHRGFRYGNFDDWSIWASLYFEVPYWNENRQTDLDKKIYGDPRNIGSNKRKNSLLRKIRHKLILHQAAHFGSTDGFVGKIPATDILNPLFADMYQFLLPGNKEYVISGKSVMSRDGKVGDVGLEKEVTWYEESGDDIVERTGVRKFSSHEDAVVMSRELYVVAEGGWKKMWEDVFKKISSPQTSDSVKSSIRAWIKNAGQAKMFPGEHLEKTIEPLLTHLILKLFVAYRGTSTYRQTLFHEVVEILELSYEGGGLNKYKDQVDAVLDNISELQHGHRVMKEVLLPFELKKREERAEYLRLIWEEKGWKIPELGALNAPGRVLMPKSGVATHQEQLFIDILDLKPGTKLPSPEVEREGTFGEVDPAKAKKEH